MFIYGLSPLESARTRKKQLYVTWFEEDRALAQPVLKLLSERGTAYVSNERSAEGCRHDDYVHNTLDKISGCSVGLVMLSKAMFREDNLELQQLLWYEIGLMLSRDIRLCVFFLDIPPQERNDYLHTTPIRQIQGTDSPEDLMEMLRANEVQEMVFYEDPELNYYASKRIRYTRITTMFNIYREDFRRIFKEVQRADDDVEDENELLTELLAELRIGCTVFRFNDIKKLKGELAPYFPEIDTIVRDYPISQNYAKPKLMNQDSSPDILATIQAEIVLPVHNLLGVTFKPFLAVPRGSHFKTSHLELILRSNTKGAADDPDRVDAAVIKENREHRVYFLMEMTEHDVEERFAQYGTRFNYLWPQ